MVLIFDNSEKCLCFLLPQKKKNHKSSSFFQLTFEDHHPYELQSTVSFASLHLFSTTYSYNKMAAEEAKDQNNEEEEVGGLEDDNEVLTLKSGKIKIKHIII